MMTTLAYAVLLLLGAPSVCRSQGDIQFEESGQCSTPNRAPGLCTNIRECSALLNVLRNQRQEPGASDFLRKSVCGYNGFDPMVCCPRNISPGRSSSQAPPVSVQPNIGSGTRLPFPDECGFSNASHPRIVNGIPAHLGAWPWMVVLGYKPPAKSTNKKPRFLCGASLITNRHVLTAGHCVHNRADLYFARLGEHDLQSDTDGANPIDILIAEKKVHKDYSPTAFINDIAILTLQQSVQYSKNIHPICLPLAPELRSKDYLNTSPFIAGWGAQNFSGPSSSILLEIQLPVVNLQKCKQAFTRFRSAVIDERVLCAGFEEGGKDACQGDSGGPLMWPKQTTYYQIGVVSYGYRCAEPGIPGVYTRVTAFLDWIVDNVK